MIDKALLSAFNCIPEHIALASLDGRIMFCNRLWEQGLSKFSCQSLFVKPDEIWPNQAITDKVFLEEVRLAFQRANAESDITVSIQKKFVHQNYQHNLVCTLSSFKNKNETILIISMNIQMDTNADDNLPFKLSPDERMILDSILEGVVIQDANGVIISNNPASEKILGLSSAQMRGLDNADSNWGTITEAGEPCPPQDHPSSLAISSGKPVYDFIMGVNGANNDVRWLKINSQPIFVNGDDKPAVSITSFVDITEEKRRQQSLIKLSERLKLALKAGELGVWEFDTETNSISWDERMFDIFDLKPSEFTGQLSDFTKTLHPDDLEQTLELFSNSLSKKQSTAFDFRIYDRHKNIRHLSGTSEVIAGANGEPDLCIGINQDITLQKNAKQLLLDQHTKLLNFVSAMPVAVFSVVDRLITINERGEHLTGYSKSELSDIDHFFKYLFCGELQPNKDFYESVTRNVVLQSKSTMQIQHKDGSRRWVTFEGCNLADRQAWVMLDMTEQINAEKQLKNLAFFDSLTGLANRHSIEQTLKSLVNSDQSIENPFGILLIDLDSFKNVNDNYGHIVGDQLLSRVSRLLNERLRASDTLGRIGGDEFMVIVRNITNCEQLLETADAFIDAFTAPVVLNDDITVSLNITLTIGASLYPTHGEDYVNLFKNADTALYHAKAHGKNRVQLYQSEFTETLKTKLELETNIEQALASKAFSIYFQPIVNCSTNTITSAECLLRWFHPELGSIAPDKFISAAETIGQIVRLGKWVIREAFKEFVKWQKNGIELDYLAINLSPVQFNDGSLVKDISHALVATGIKPNRIVLEITEGMLVHNQTSTSKILKQLKDMGIRLAIDDFGTGYSSLAYLKYFNVDILKIDRSFITDITDNLQDRQIVEAIISMAKDLKLKIVAEGVETEAQLEFLKAHDCNTYQGYFKSPAISSNDFAKIMLNEIQIQHA